MRTIDDVQDAFRALAEIAPEPAPLPLAAAPTDGRAHRSWASPVAAAAATVLVAGGLVYATTNAGDDGTQPGGHDVASHNVPALTAPPADGAPDLTFHFTATAPDAGTVAAYGIDRDGQVVDFRPTAGSAACRTRIGSAQASACDPTAEVRLHYVNPAPDRDEPPFDPAGVTHRVATEVNGRPAFFGRIDDALDPTEKLYWEYAPGALAEASAPSRAAELALAESVRVASEPVRIPVAPTLTDHHYANLVTSEPGDAAGDFEVTSADAQQGGFHLGWGRDAYGATVPPSDPQEFTVNGRTWTITGGRQLLATLKDSAVPLTVLPYLGTDRAALREILRGLRLAPDHTDPTTWFSAADVLH
jgi:hypothetical protein